MKGIPGRSLPHAASRQRASKGIFLIAACLMLGAFPVIAGSGPRNGKARLAPHFTLATRRGTTIDSDSLRGKPVLVDFWASWCRPCQESFPWLSRMDQQFHDRGLTVVAICLDKSRTAAGEFLEANPAPFLVAFDPEGKTAEAFDVSAMPTTYLVSRTGTILYNHKGFDPKDTGRMEAAIQQACNQ